MRLDLLMTILGILLVLAMILTLIYGREHGRHGYGKAAPPPGEDHRKETAALPLDNPHPLYCAQKA
ncbi:MAG: hypothetical protein RQ722_00705 [Desulfuromonadales bacterium]|nr:hypothetical protein [Desulfuromonadales bacterium]